MHYSYAHKLQDPRWQKRRLEILTRDKFTCQKCEDTKETLHIHHRHYATGREPWDYPNELLVTLCKKCHKEEEDCADKGQQILETMHFWGFFNTEIIAELNKLIEARISLNKTSDAQ